MDPYFENAEKCVERSKAAISIESQTLWLLEAQAQALLALTMVVAGISRR